MADHEHNREYGDYVEIWKDLPIVVVSFVKGGSVANIIPCEPDVDDMELARIVEDEGIKSGSLCDLYQHGWHYNIAFDQTDLDRLATLSIQNAVNPFRRVMATVLARLRDQHHALYFPDEIPVDEEG